MRGKWNRRGEAILLGVPLVAILFLLVTLMARHWW